MKLELISELQAGLEEIRSKVNFRFLSTTQTKFTIWQELAAAKLLVIFGEEEAERIRQFRIPSMSLREEALGGYKQTENMFFWCDNYLRALKDEVNLIMEADSGKRLPMSGKRSRYTGMTGEQEKQIPKIKISEAESKWLEWAYNWFWQGFLFDVDKASKAMFDKGEWKTGFRPYDIDERLLVDGNKPTLLGVMYVEPSSPLLPLTHEIATYIKKGLAINRKMDKLSVKAMAVDLGTQPELVSRALDLLWLAGDFIKSLSHTQTSVPGQLSRPGQLPVYESLQVGHPVIYESYEKYEGLEQLIADKYSADEEEPAVEATVTKILGRYDLLKALVGHRSAIETKLKRFPFEKNVFIMMKYRPSNKTLSDFIKEELEKHGLRGVRADEPQWNITRDIYNPLAVLYCCKYGLALFDEAEEGQIFSPNVAYELGIMHYQQKNCLILKHTSLPTSPFDLLKDLHKSYSRDLEVREMIKTWITEIADE